MVPNDWVLQSNMLYDPLYVLALKKAGYYNSP